MSHVLTHRFAPIDQSYGWADTALYALACGAGADERDLLVHTPAMMALPSMAAVLAHPGNWYAQPGLGLHALGVVHAGERVELTGDLPVQGQVRAQMAVVAVRDKGPGRGALILTRRQVQDAVTGRLLATVTSRVYARGDGGIGDGGEPALSRPAPLPDRVPDRVIAVPTSPRAAALYRLLGDDNPLHIDPEFAQKAGFDRPILHGLATYGHIARALLRDGNGVGFRLLDCRFTAPVYPGQTLTMDLWDTDQGRVFRARVGARVVVDQGMAG